MDRLPMIGLPPAYDAFASWWPLWSAAGDYEEEAGIYRSAFEQARPGGIRSVLELGCGGGNNASHLKRHYDLTLTDLSPAMLAVSKAENPECRHVVGDMRTLRLGRTFDAVFVHDAVAYLTSEGDLRRAMATARAHLGPGGSALFVPDDTTETWKPSVSHGGHDGDGRSLRYLAWSYDEDPTDTEVATAFAFILREGRGPPTMRSEVHRNGLFPRATWIRLLSEAGLQPRTLPYLHSSFESDAGRVLFLGEVPA
jgi:SAM-dependent methyltransferase